uniref:Cathepsin propeptide inhibitor domain-containing protein n=1 Tax=Arundo donax TaxID=35708 RepID=A0A0A9CE53_ARUDO
MPGELPDGYRPGKDVLGEHLVSDETIWVLYENWCKAYNKERNYAEMVCRFDQFKMNAILVHGHNCGFSGRMILGEFADGRERKPLPAEKYLILKEVVSTPAINIHESPSTLN